LIGAARLTARSAFLLCIGATTGKQKARHAEARRAITNQKSQIKNQK
jgi:hypothetical protein